MDLELLRTFIEVYRCRHFGKAADRLYITQSAVSARIRQLEGNLGCQLLIRERKQVQPTADGERFLQHAENVLRQWERARRDMTDSVAGGPPLRLGVVPALWEMRVCGWLANFHRAYPEVRLHVDSHEVSLLIPRLLEGSLDLVLQFDAPRLADSEHRLIDKVHLVLASTIAGQDFAGALQNGYIALEWGSAFATAQAGFLTNGGAAFRVDGLQAALSWMQGNAAAAYLPEEIVSREAHLHFVEGAPRFTREFHAAWLAQGQHRNLIEQFLSCRTDES